MRLERWCGKSAFNDRHVIVGSEQLTVRAAVRARLLREDLTVRRGSEQAMVYKDSHIHRDTAFSIGEAADYMLECPALLPSGIIAPAAHTLLFYQFHR